MNDGTAQDTDFVVGNEEVVVIKASDLYQLFGEYALPPYPCGCGTNTDCAPMAEEIIARINALQL